MNPWKQHMACLRWSSSAGFSLIEVVVGGALLLIAGVLLNEAASRTEMFEKRYDQNFVMRQILNRIADETLKNNHMYFAFKCNPKNHKVYYGCFNEKLFIKGDMEFGISTFHPPDSFFSDPAKCEIAHASVTSKNLVENHIGLEKKTVAGEDTFELPTSCKDNDEVQYIAFMLPSPKSSDVYLWVYALKRDDSIVAGIRDRITVTPYL